MNNKVLKKVFVTLICMVLIVGIIAPIIANGYGTNNNYSMIGTNSALGSSMLSSKFSPDNWNRWEMVTWGVFLSNFCTPLIDDYRSAFDLNSKSGSRGSGCKALKFGTGADSTSDETIKNLLTYAIQQQTSGNVKQLWVSYNNINRGGVTPNTEKQIREASLKDLFLGSYAEQGLESWAKVEDYAGTSVSNTGVFIQDGSGNRGMSVSGNQYVDIATINEGQLPTFSVQYNANSYETVFDYTNSWDAQVMTAWFSRTFCGDYKEEFCSTLDDIWDKADSMKLVMDCFGNICVFYNNSYRVVIPASVNQHLTSSPKINLLSSLIFNGYNGGESNNELILDGRQSTSAIFEKKGGTVRYGGLPAFGAYESKMKTGSVYFYYDLDTIAYQNYFKGGDAQDTLRDGNFGHYSDIGAYNLNYGLAVKKLFDSDINKQSSNDIAFKIESSGTENIDIEKSLKNKFASSAMRVLNIVSGQIANIVGTNNGAKVLSKVKTFNGEINLFNDPVIVPVQMEASNSGSINATGMARKYLDYVYQIYNNGNEAYSTTFNLNSNDVINVLNNSKTVEEFKNNLLGNGKVTKIMAGYLCDDNINSNNIKMIQEKEKLLNSVYDGNNIFAKPSSIKYNNEQVIDAKYDTTGNLKYFGCRLIKIYPISNTMKAVGNVLGVREGTEFGLYSTYIYLTYLDWYGVNNSKSTSEFNQKIFDAKSSVLSVDIPSLVKTMSKEEKEQEILNNTYLMLDPVKGKEYRASIASGVLTDWIYETYQKIVYGKASNYYYEGTSNLASRNATGFLKLSSYSENFATGWFLNIYSKIALGIIGIAFALIVIIGILKKKKLSWFLISLAVAINTVLIVPSAGEIAPGVVNNLVQNMFSDKMTYWSVSESIKNQGTEESYIDNDVLGGLNLNDEEARQVMSTKKSLGMMYLDRSLMIKKDISSKITEAQNVDLYQIQQMQSTRWLIPMLTQQISAEDKSANYVYTSLGSLYDNMSNMYWYYKPEDGITSKTILGSSLDYTTGEVIKANERNKYYIDYKNTTNNDDIKVDYRSQAYTNHKEIDEMPHTYFYLLKDITEMLSRKEGFNGDYEKGSFDKYITNTLQHTEIQNQFKTTAKNIGEQASNYNSSDRKSMNQCYGYLWATENPSHYFYQSIKDSFNSYDNVHELIGNIQGQYITNESGKEVRVNFMYADKTGKVKDVLDLEELFTNMVPYLYQMQITAGGTNGTSGVLGDAKISNYALYEDNYESWLFRSNWVTKIMESPEYTKQCTVYDKNGNKYIVANPTLTECYPEDRQMVFSEAQMYAQGLNEKDLSLIELKCVKINKDTTKKWTMLLNYAGTPDITKEVLYRQMALESLLAFNKEFSGTSVLNSAYQMYPNSVDLRQISFDSVMKMLMLNVTRNTSYVYGDTMKGITDNSDIFTALLLLASAFMCTYVIPFIRNIGLALVFYLGFVAMIYALMADNRQKVKTSCGYVVTNLAFTVATIIYYAVFAGLMAVTASDSVLTVQSVQINTGNPVWCFIIILAVSCAYIWVMIKLIDICLKNYRDMGYGMYKEIAGNIADTVSKKFNAAKVKSDKRTFKAGTNKHGDNDIEEDININNRKAKPESGVDSQQTEEQSYRTNYDNIENSDIDIDINKEIEKGKNKRERKKESNKQEPIISDTNSNNN